MDKKLTLQRVWSCFLQEAAKKRWYTIEFLEKEKNIFFIKNKNKEILFKWVEWWLTSKLWRGITVDKDLTHLLLKRNNIKYPQYIIIDKEWIIDYDEIEKIWYPLITEPVNWSIWRWVVINIQDREGLDNAIQYSFQFGKTIMIQEYVEWDNLRILIVNHKKTAWLKRIRHHIIGDGKSTVKELLEKENINPQRWNHQLESILPQIKIDEDLELFFQTQYKINFSDILEKDKQGFLKWNGYSKVIDITDDIPVEICKVCEEISKIFKLPVAWVDVIYNKDTKKYRVLEVNSQPWIKTHHLPMEWKARNVAGAILDLYLE